MPNFDLTQLSQKSKDEQTLLLTEINTELETLSAEDRIRWALEHLQGEFALASSFGIQSAVMLHMVTQAKPDIPVILTDTGYHNRKVS